MNPKDAPRQSEAEPIPDTSGIADEPFLEERPIILTPEDQRFFFEALMSPPKVKPALRKLMRGTDATET